MSQIEDLQFQNDVTDDVEYPQCLFHFTVNNVEYAVGSNYIEINPYPHAFSNNSLESFVEDAEENLPFDIKGKYEGLVYSLDCQNRNSPEELKIEASVALGCSEENVPSWVWAAYHSPTREYIGGTYRPDKRLAEHRGWREDYEGSTFTSIFPADYINYVLLVLDGDVYELEENVAEYWQSDRHFDDVFVYQA